MIGPYFEGGRVLDLYAGSGGLSIEAVSRGMSSAVLGREGQTGPEYCGRKYPDDQGNLKVSIIENGVQSCVGAGGWRFDLIFLDPPMQRNKSCLILKNGRARSFSEDVMVVCETDKSVELPEEIACLGIWKEKIYGISKVTVYVR